MFWDICMSIARLTKEPNFRGLYQIFPVDPSLLYKAMGTQANDKKSFQFDPSI